MNPLRRLAAKVAHEPVTTISTGILAVVGWVGPIVVDDFNAAAVDEKFGTAATALGVLIGLVARQFVTPVQRKTSVPPSAPKSLADPAAPGD